MVDQHALSINNTGNSFINNNNNNSIDDNAFNKNSNNNRVKQPIKDNFLLLLEHILICNNSKEHMAILNDLLYKNKGDPRLNQPHFVGESGMYYLEAPAFTYYVSKVDGVPATLAHYAVCRRRIDILELLGDNGVLLNVHVKDNTGIDVTPEMVARLNGDVDVARFLSNFGKPTRVSQGACVIS